MLCLIISFIKQGNDDELVSVKYTSTNHNPGRGVWIWLRHELSRFPGALGQIIMMRSTATPSCSVVLAFEPTWWRVGSLCSDFRPYLSPGRLVIGCSKSELPSLIFILSNLLIIRHTLLWAHLRCYEGLFFYINQVNYIYYAFGHTQLWDPDRLIHIQVKIFKSTSCFLYMIPLKYRRRSKVCGAIGQYQLQENFWV